MSELIAEARVLVTPDTTGFRPVLVEQLAVATRGVTVTVPVTPVVTTTGAAAAAREVTAAENASADAIRGATEAKRAAQIETVAYTRRLHGLSTGAASAALSVVGLRGATLAASAPFLAGAAGAIAFTKAVSGFSDLQSTLNVFRVTAGATADEMERVSEIARSLGQDITLPGVSATDAAEAITELSKAGLSVEDSLSGARGVLQLATAAAISNADATKIAASALNAFGLSGSDAVRVADLLANAANASQGEITDMAIGLQQAAAVAHQVGISLEDTVGFLTLLSKAGLAGSDAGTSLRVAFTRLINPTEKASEVIAKLGVNLRDAQGNIRPDVFRQFAAAQADLSRKQQDANAAIVFGTDALRAYSIISRATPAEVANLTAELDKQGTAADLAAARTSGLAGAAENLKNQLSGLGIVVGEVASGPLQGLVTALGNVVQEATDGVTALVSFGRAAKENIPQIQIGPVDTTEFDRSFKERVLDKLSRPEELFAPITALPRVDIQVSTEKAQQEIQKITDALEKAGGTPLSFQDAVTSLEELRKKIEQNGGSATALTDTLAEFIAQLQTLSAQPDIELPIELPPELISGDAGEEAGRTTAVRFGETFLPTLEQVLKEGTAAAVSGGIDPGVQEFLAGLRENVANAFLAVGRAASDVIDVEFRGGSQSEIRAALERELKRQQAFVDALIARGASRKRIDAAKEDANRTQAQIDAIDRQQAADAKARRDKRKREAEAAAREAAATFLGTQEDARARQERLIGLAQDTTTLRDDITRRQGLRTLITRQIQAIRESTLDEKTKREAIKELARERQATTDQINRLVVEDRRQRQAQAEEAQEQRESALIALGESILDLTGNKNPLLRAIDAAVKDAIKERNAAKKGSVAFIQAQTEINELLKRRKDLIEGVQEGAKDEVTAFELLQQNAQTFLRTGGNLVTGNQPFAGPTGFTADIAQFLTRANTRVSVVTSQDPSTKTQSTQLNANVVRLTDVLERLIDVQTGGRDPAAVEAIGRQRARERSFYLTRVARQLAESETT